MSMKTYPLELPTDLIAEVKRTAQDTQLSMADAMRQAIRLGLPQLRKALSREEVMSAALTDTRRRPGPRPKFKLVKEDGFTVIETDRKVSQKTIDELLTERP